jgi:thioesterase domain-containing protein
MSGWSFGGVLASEVARQLEASGAPAKGLVLLDSPYPIEHQPMPDAIITHVADTAFSTKSERRGCIEAQFKRNARLLEGYNPPLDTFSIPTAMLLCRETFNTTRPCGISYAWLDNQDYRTRCARDWQRVVGSSMQVLEVEGNHFNMFSARNVSHFPPFDSLTCLTNSIQRFSLSPGSCLLLVTSFARLTSDVAISYHELRCIIDVSFADLSPRIAQGRP